MGNIRGSRYELASDVPVLRGSQFATRPTQPQRATPESQQASTRQERQDVVAVKGGYISKDEFNRLSPEDQQRIRTIGVDQFNVENNASVAKFKSENVEIKGGWMAKADFNALSPTDQQRIRTLGVAAFNAENQARQDAVNAKLKNYVAPEGGYYIVKALAEGAVTEPELTAAGYDTTGLGAQASEYKTAVAENAAFRAANVEVRGTYNTGEWVDKAFYDALPTRDKEFIRDYGIARYNSWTFGGRPNLGGVPIDQVDYILKTGSAAGAVALGVAERKRQEVISTLAGTKYDAGGDNYRIVDAVADGTVSIANVRAADMYDAPTLDQIEQNANTMATLKRDYYVPEHTEPNPEFIGPVDKKHPAPPITIPEGYRTYDAAADGRITTAQLVGANFIANTPEATKEFETQVEKTREVRQTLQNLEPAKTADGFYDSRKIQAALTSGVVTINQLRNAGFDVASAETLQDEQKKIEAYVNSKEGYNADGMALMSAIQNAGYQDKLQYWRDNAGWHIGSKSIGLKNPFTSDTLPYATIVKTGWNNLTPEEKANVTYLWAADKYKGSFFAETSKIVSEGGARGGIAGQLIVSPVTGITQPIAKKITGQHVSTGEWVGAGVTAVADALMLSPLLGTLPRVGIIATSAKVGTAGVIGYGAVQYAQGVRQMTNAERAVYGGILLLGAGALVHSSLSPAQKTKISSTLRGAGSRLELRTGIMKGTERVFVSEEGFLGERVPTSKPTSKFDTSKFVENLKPSDIAKQGARVKVNTVLVVNEAGELVPVGGALRGRAGTITVSEESLVRPTTQKQMPAREAARLARKHKAAQTFERKLSQQFDDLWNDGRIQNDSRIGRSVWELEKSQQEPLVLNAKSTPDFEAYVEAVAGEPGRVTIGTQMVGRGMNIKLVSDPYYIWAKGHWMEPKLQPIIKKVFYRAQTNLETKIAEILRKGQMENPPIKETWVVPTETQIGGLRPLSFRARITLAIEGIKNKVDISPSGAVESFGIKAVKTVFPDIEQLVQRERANLLLANKTATLRKAYIKANPNSDVARALRVYDEGQAQSMKLMSSKQKVYKGMTTRQIVEQLVNIDDSRYITDSEGGGFWIREPSALEWQRLRETHPLKPVAPKLDYPLWISDRLRGLVLLAQVGGIQVSGEMPKSVSSFGHIETSGKIVYSTNAPSWQGIYRATNPVKGMTSLIRENLVHFEPDADFIGPVSEAYPAPEVAIEGTEAPKGTQVYVLSTHWSVDPKQRSGRTNLIPVQGDTNEARAWMLVNQVIKSVEKEGWNTTLKRFGLLPVLEVFPKAIIYAAEEAGAIDYKQVQAALDKAREYYKDPAHSGSKQASTLILEHLENNMDSLQTEGPSAKDFGTGGETQPAGGGSGKPTKGAWSGGPLSPEAQRRIREENVRSAQTYESKTGISDPWLLKPKASLPSVSQPTAATTATLAPADLKLGKAVVLPEIERQPSTLPYPDINLSTLSRKIELVTPSILLKDITELGLSVSARHKAQQRSQTIVNNITKHAQRLSQKNLTISQLAQQLQQEAKTEVQQQQNQQVKQAVQIAVQIAVQQVVQQIIQQAIPKPTPQRVTPPFIIIPPSSKRTKEPPKLYPPGSVGWRQGSLRKSVYWVMYKEHRKIVTKYHGQTPPVGVKIVSGLRSAYESFGKTPGYVPREMKGELGIMDVRSLAHGKEVRFKRVLSRGRKGKPTTSKTR